MPSILLIEDDDLLREALMPNQEGLETSEALRQLRAGSFDVMWERVDTPEAMRAALDRQPWDLVLSDYKMPRFSGLAAMKVLDASGIEDRGQHPAGPVRPTAALSECVGGA